MSVYSDWRSGALTYDEYREMLKDEEWLDNARGYWNELPEEYNMDDEEVDDDGE